MAQKIVRTDALTRFWIRVSDFTESMCLTSILGSNSLVKISQYVCTYWPKFLGGFVWNQTKRPSDVIFPDISECTCRYFYGVVSAIQTKMDRFISVIYLNEKNQKLFKLAPFHSCPFGNYFSLQWRFTNGVLCFQICTTFHQ